LFLFWTMIIISIVNWFLDLFETHFKKHFLFNQKPIRSFDWIVFEWKNQFITIYRLIITLYIEFIDLFDRISEWRVGSHACEHRISNLDERRILPKILEFIANSIINQKIYLNFGQWVSNSETCSRMQIHAYNQFYYFSMQLPFNTINIFQRQIHNKNKHFFMHLVYKLTDAVLTLSADNDPNVGLCYSSEFNDLFDPTLGSLSADRVSTASVSLYTKCIKKCFIFMWICLLKYGLLYWMAIAWEIIEWLYAWIASGTGFTLLTHCPIV